MTPDEVPEPLVRMARKAARNAPCHFSPEEMRHALAAVIPEIQAQAMEDLAKRVRSGWASMPITWVGALDDEAIRLRGQS